MNMRQQSTTCAALIAALFVVFAVSTVEAGPTPIQKCTSSKQKAAGKHGQCHTGVISKGVAKALAPDAAKAAKCDLKTASGFEKAEDKAAGACLTIGDGATAAADIEQCSNDLADVILNGTDPLAGGAEAKCDSKKIKTAGKYLACVYGTRSKATAKGLAPDYTKCDEKLTKSIDSSNAKGPCSATGDLSAIKALADGCLAATLFDGTIFSLSSTFTLDCSVVGIPVSLPIDVTAASTTGPLVAGSPIDITLTSNVNISEATADNLVTLLTNLGQPTSAVIDYALLSTLATAGADAANPQDLPLVGPIAVDLADDTSVPPNGIPGPHQFSTTPVATIYQVSAGATQLEIAMDGVEVGITAAGIPLILTAPGAECSLIGDPIVILVP